jgi:hypothetical protein
LGLLAPEDAYFVREDRLLAGRVTWLLSSRDHAPETCMGRANVGRRTSSMPNEHFSRSWGVRLRATLGTFIRQKRKGDLQDG